MSLVLSGCGGNGTSSFAAVSSSSSGTSVVNTVSSIALVTNSPQIPSNGSTPATITAVAKNANNAIVSGATVVFSTNSGVIAPQVTTTGITAGITDQNGNAAAALSTPGDEINRVITVTATVGTVSATVNVAVIGTSITVTGPASLIQGATGTFNVSLTDSAGAGIAGATVAVSSAKSNSLSAASLVTDSTGHVTVTYTATNAGNDTVTATALGLSASQAVSISSESFNFTVPSANADVALNAAQSLTVVWTNAGAPVAGQTVTLTTTRGLFANGATTTTATTNSTGTVGITAAPISISSTTAGPAVLTATGTGVSAQLQINFIATVPSQIDVQATPDTVQTAGQSTITAIVRDAQDNLVQGQTVDFQLTDKSGGSISVGTAVTNAQGVAQTVYTATSVASSSNGVQVTATVQGTAIQDSVTLTVGGQTVFLSLGTGAVVSENASKTQFLLPYSVLALDSAGNAVPGATVTFTVVSLPPTGAPSPVAPDFVTPTAYAAYGKGVWFVCGSVWCQGNEILLPDGSPELSLTGALEYGPVSTCLNEDILDNGIFETSEDANNNGKLDPGNVATVSPGSIVTDSTGTGNITITYPEDHAEWVQVLLTASASVSGTQSSTSARFWLPILAAYVNNTTSSPPGVISPYGTNINCHIAN
jgi:hypothetical protein